MHAKQIIGFTTDQAAIYLGLSIDTIRKHIKTERIRSEKINGMRIFSKEELDRYKRERRGPGRPPK